MRLIDADKLKKHYAWWQGGTLEKTLDEMKRDFDTIIDLQPTVEAEPIKHGRWKVNNETEEWVTIYCDQCHDGMWNRKGDPYPNYCFNCGANMQEVELTASAEMHPEKYFKNLNEAGRMRVVDVIEMLETQKEQLKEKYCNECQEWSCENCWARIDEVE